MSAAASLAAGFGAGGVGVSGAGADANNVILTGTHAYVADSTVHSSAGKVDIDATNAASIDALILGVSVGVGGGVVGIGGSIGVAIARNYIGWGQDDGTAANYTTGDNPATLGNGQTVKIAAGPGAGNVYRYIGTATLTRPTATGSDPGTGNARREQQLADPAQLRRRHAVATGQPGPGRGRGSGLHPRLERRSPRAP